MRAWVPLTVTALALAAILALLLPRRQLLLLGIAAVAGVVASVLVNWWVPPRASGETYQVHYLVVALPALCFVSAILGYLWPWKAWQWGVMPFLADAIWQVLGPYSTVAWGNLGPIPYIFPFYSAALAAIPAIVAAELAARVARRRQDHGGGNSSN
jgi:hypothetical protein